MVTLKELTFKNERESRNIKLKRRHLTIFVQIICCLTLKNVVIFTNFTGLIKKNNEEIIPF